MNKQKKQKEIYLDYAAATPVDPLVLKKMAPYWKNLFANPSSTHSKGVEARAAVNAARREVARVLSVKPQEIIFTSGGTEANSMALQGICNAHFLSKKTKTKQHVLISAGEHSSVEEALSYYEKRGEVFVEKIPLTKEGLIDLGEFKKLLRTETILVSTLLVSNKTGVIQPIRQMGGIIKTFRKKNKNHALYFHTDASQAPRYLSIRPHMLGVDLLTLDGAKIYGPKGVGILFVKEGTEIAPLIKGGGQERGMRSGTINTPLVVGFAEALLLCEKKREEDNKKIGALKYFFIKTLIKNCSYAKINTPISKSVSGVISVFFPRENSEELFVKLNTLGIYTSLGSACESETLNIISTHKKNTDALRISLGRETTKKEINTLLKTLFTVLSARDII